MQSKKSYLLFILVCAIFGHTFLAISMGIQAGASPLFLAALRFTAAGVLMLTGLLISGKADWASLKRLLVRSIILSLFLTVGTFGCMFIAQTHVDSGFMARLDAAGPLVTAFLAALFFKKKITPLHMGAFILGMGGSFLIAAPAVSAEPFYLIFAVATVLFYALANAIYPRLFAKEDDPVTVSALQALCGGLILLVLAFVFEPVSLPGAAIGPLLYLILAGSILGHTATLILVRDAGPVFASSWLYVAPVIATISGYFVLGETITPAGMAGTVIALAGVFVLDRAESRQLKAESGQRKAESGQRTADSGQRTADSGQQRVES
ncbi:MAG: EamA family transporter [Spirochaetales bacterium]|nr:EamA family transporter [Spirochaetales bacterium]